VRHLRVVKQFSRSLLEALNFIKVWGILINEGVEDLREALVFPVLVFKESHKLFT
jgi:hypothetical protein